MICGEDVKEIPDIVFQYWGLIVFMNNSPGMYGLDKRRREVHIQMCQYLNIDIEKSRWVTDNALEYDNTYYFYKAMLKLKED